MEIYVYNISDFEEENKDISDLVKSGKAVMFDISETKLLAKTKFLTIDGVAHEPQCTLDEFLDLYDDGRYYVKHDLTSTNRIDIKESIVLLQSALYTKMDNGVKSFAERIYTSENPEEEISELLEKFVPLVLFDRAEFLIENGKVIEQEIKDGIFEWHF
jgi:hypothetical protein